MNKIKNVVKHVLMSRFSNSIFEIDVYVDEMQKFLQIVMKTIVSWTIFNRFVKFFWNDECNATIKNTRRLRRQWSASQNQHDLTQYMRINDRKQKIIQKTKRVNFRQKMKKMIDIFTSLWRLIKWIKNKNH